MYEKRFSDLFLISTIRFIILSVIFVSFATASDSASSEPSSSNEIGMPAIDYNQERFAMLQEAAAEVKVEAKEDIEKKSGIKAAFFSAIVPGGGQFYTKNYWRAALYAGLEIALWSAYIIYNNKGNDVDTRMRTFGDEHWNEQQYWSHLYYQASQKGLEGLPNYRMETITREGLEGEMYLLAEYNPDIVNSIRYLEGELGYTHVLPNTKTQQYYEMVYKYLHQFGVGWDDVWETFNDPYYYDFGDLNNLTPNIAYYRDLRNESNGYYDIANNMLSVILVNHVISAIDAAFAAKKYNEGVQYSFRASSQRIAGERLNMLGIVLTW